MFHQQGSPTDVSNLLTTSLYLEKDFMHNFGHGIDLRKSPHLPLSDPLVSLNRSSPKFVMLLDWHFDALMHTFIHVFV